jgi:Fe-S cluster assembly protein SufB
MYCPMRDENQLARAVVEIYAMKDAQVKYSTFKTGIPVIRMERGYL